MCSFLSVQN